ncbi:uncharacterized protein [Coffea arabica]
MASTVPAKSQPLHNFSLSHLKWKGNHQRPRSASSSAARLSASGSPHRSPPFSHDSPPRRQSLNSPLRSAADSVAASSPSRHAAMLGGEDSAASPMLHGDGADELTAPLLNQSPVRGNGTGKLESCVKSSKPLIEYRRHSRPSVSSVVKNGVFTSSPDRDERKLKGAGAGAGAEAEAQNTESRSSKFLIKIRQKTSKFAEEIQPEEEGKAEVKVQDNEVQDEGKLLASFDDDEPLQKTWNFRPRKPIRPSLNLNGSGFKNNGSTVQHAKRAQSPQVNPNSGNRSENQKKEKRKIGFTLALSREEIEEDLFALLGSKPSRRPKKRSKTVQKLMDNVFPGAWLQSITADSYKVSEHPGKA